MEELHKYHSTRAGKNSHVVLCGGMTPEQKAIGRRQAEIDTYLYVDCLTGLSTNLVMEARVQSAYEMSVKTKPLYFKKMTMITTQIHW